MNLVYVYADTEREWNCSEWRCAVPARALQRTGRHTASLLSLQDFAAGGPAARAACDAADVIVVQRNLFGPVLSAMQHWKARGKTVVVDFDDAYDLMPPTNPSYRFWHAGLSTAPDGREERLSPEPLKQFQWGLRLAHGATVPSRRLGDDAVSGRMDAFRTRDRTFRSLDDNQENGWAATASWLHRLAPHADLIVEAQHVASKRDARRLVGEDPKQDQTVLQSALRLSF